MYVFVTGDKMKKEDRILFQLAVELWRNDQIIQTFEELGELIDVLAKMNRGRASIKDLASEVVDVGIMLDQLKIMFDIEVECEQIRIHKLNKLRVRINENLEN